MSRRLVTGGLIGAALLGAAGCDPSSPTASPTATTPGPAPAPADSRALFVDVTDAVGLDFRHHSGHVGRHVLPEIMGGGAAVFDFDGDGDLDVYLVDSGDHLPISDHAITTPNRLFRQEADGTFTDVTAASGLGDLGYGMGCAVGDIDDDGDLDVYVTNWGPDTLYRNDGDGSFTDITAEAGIDNQRWSSAAAFLDYDRDGDLDLYVANYLQYNPHRECTDSAGRPAYCGPAPFPGDRDLLYRNEGGGRFTDVSQASGIGSAALAGLGVVCADLDDDGWIDVYVANDGDPNLLWVNQGDGTFVDDAIILGAAYNRHGEAEAGMGVTAGDVSGDGDLDLFMTHLASETNTLYRNLGSAGYDDGTAEAGLAAASSPYTGFGTAFFDYDNDGDLDLAVVNGTVARRPVALADEPPFWNEYVEPNFLFRNDGYGHFAPAEHDAGRFATELGISRGFIPADFDGDGDLDMLVTNIEGPTRLYRNQLDDSAWTWIDLELRLPDRNREALGSKATIVTDRRTLVRHAIPPGGYVTSGHATIHVGLAAGETVRRITVRWPDGDYERFAGSATGGTIVLEKGAGEPGAG